MFNGPELSGFNPGPQFGPCNAFDPIVGAGVPMPSAFLFVPGRVTVGMGNVVLVHVHLDLLAPVAATDIKWVDIMMVCDFPSPDIRWPMGYVPGTIGLQTFVRMDVMSEPDPRYPNWQMAKHKWTYHRFPNPLDPDNLTFQPPGPGGVPVNAMPAFCEWAYGDGARAIYRLVGMDVSVDPILRVGETIQVSIASGTFARTP